MVNFNKHQKEQAAKVFFAASIAALTCWLAYKKFRKPSLVAIPGRIGIDAERYRFKIPAEIGTGTLELERRGASFAVRLKGKYLGRIFKRGNDWIAKGRSLRPYFDVIVKHLPNSGSRNGFTDILYGVYPEIESTNWRTDETLEIVVNEHTDLEVFTTFLKDEVNNLTDFDDHIDIMVKKQEGNYFTIVSVN